MFRRKQQQQRQNYASTPLDAPGSLHASRRSNVGANGDIDELIEQEIRRYEELFESNDNAFPSPADDDTLMDGSIYTSNNTLAPPESRMLQQPSLQAPLPPHLRNQGRASALPPRLFGGAGHSDPSNEEDSMMESLWGLPEPKLPIAATKKAPTKLLNSRESAAAQACATENHRPTAAITKGSNNESKSSSVSPVTPAHIDQMEAKKKEQKVTPVADSKRSQTKRSLSTRLFGKEKTTTASTNIQKKKMMAPLPHQQRIPFTPSTRPTTKTAASTAAPPPASNATSKLKFFSRAKLFHNTTPSDKTIPPVKSSNKGPQNLFLSSRKIPAKTVPPITIKQQQPPLATPTRQNHHLERPRPPSPPPPFDCFQYETHSVGSYASSLTEALDAWFQTSAPPQIIGGNHLVNQVVEEYDGGLSPAKSSDSLEEPAKSVHIEFDLQNDTDDEPAITATVSKEDPPVERLEDVASPPLKDKEQKDAFSHNSAPSLVRPTVEEQQQDISEATDHENDDNVAAKALIRDLAAIVTVNDGGKKQKEETCHQEEENEIVRDNSVSHAADRQIEKVSGLQHKTSCPQEHITEAGVKRNLFGTNNGDSRVRVAKTSAQQPAFLEKKGTAVHTQYKPEDKMTSAPVVAPTPSQTKQKSSKFKKFLTKLAGKPSANFKKSKENDQEWLENELLKAAKLESERLQLEEARRRLAMEEKEMLELRKLKEAESHQSSTSDTGSSSDELELNPAKPRFFSLLSGSMVAEEGADATTDITEFPTPSPPLKGRTQHQLKEALPL